MIKYKLILKLNSSVDNVPSSMLEGVKSVSVSLNKHSSHIYVYFPVKIDSGEGDHPAPDDIEA